MGLTELIANYPDFRVVKEMTEALWIKQFGHQPEGLFLAAIQNHIAESKSPPTVACINLQITRLKNIHSGADEFGEALKSIKMAVARSGIHEEERAYKFMTPLAVEAMKCYGWRNWCMTETSQIGVRNAQFKAIFDSIKKREQTKETFTPQIRELLENVKASVKTIGDH